MSKAIQLGSKVRDSHTGFIGIATSRSESLYGPPRICIEASVDKEGKVTAPQWFDEPRVEPIFDEKPRIGFDPGPGFDSKL